MKTQFHALCLLALLVLVAAWSKEDQEIFRLQDEVEASEGPGVTFYDFIGVAPNVNQDDLNKAYKKRSKALHPDKVKRQFVADKTTGKDRKKGSKKPSTHASKGPSQAEIRAAAKVASDRFSRLGLVNSILKGSGRERYDHFLRNGFPTWKGTGYYYARFRPGLGSVLTGLFIFVGGAGHYLVLYMNWKRQRDFIGRYIKHARSSAWGDNFVVPGLDTPVRIDTPPPTTGNDEGGEDRPLPRNRKERRMMEKEDKKQKPEKKSRLSKAAKAAASPVDTPPVAVTGPKKRVQAENGKVLVVDAAGNVYVEQQDEDGETHEYLLDPNEIQAPAFKDTALFRAPVWAFNSTVGRILKKPVAVSDEVDSDGDTLEDTPDASTGDEEFELLERSKTFEPNGGKKAKKNK